MQGRAGQQEEPGRGVGRVWTNNMHARPQGEAGGPSGLRQRLPAAAVKRCMGSLSILPSAWDPRASGCGPLSVSLNRKS